MTAWNWRIRCRMQPSSILVLPGMDGYALARQLKACSATRKTLLVAVTGYGRDEDREWLGKRASITTSSSRCSWTHS